MMEFKMKKAIKRIVAMLCVVTTVGAYALPALATTQRGVSCPNCGRNCTTRTTYDDWRETSTVRDCIHYAYGEDRLEERDVYQLFSCGHCGASGEVLIRTEERWVCHGSRG